jgi:tRNA uridine 5-carbamoylmethylation protein Kti12
MKAVVLAGLPGSGKSTLVKSLLDKQRTESRFVCSADHFFEQPDGSYLYDKNKLHQAHARCLQKFISAIDLYGGTPDVPSPEFLVVDNTNLTVAEIAPYIAIANAFNLVSEVWVCQANPVLCAERNQHSVPPLHIGIMAERFEYTLKNMPPWWTVIRERVVDMNDGKGPVFYT